MEGDTFEQFIRALNDAGTGVNFPIVQHNSEYNRGW